MAEDGQNGGPNFAPNVILLDLNVEDERSGFGEFSGNAPAYVASFGLEDGTDIKAYVETDGGLVFYVQDDSTRYSVDLKQIVGGIYAYREATGQGANSEN